MENKTQTVSTEITPTWVMWAYVAAYQETGMEFKESK